MSAMTGYQSINFLFRNNKKNTLYMYMSNQNKKVLLRGGHMAHNVPSSCDHWSQTINVLTTTPSTPLKLTQNTATSKSADLHSPQRWSTGCSCAGRRRTRRCTWGSDDTDTTHQRPSSGTAPQSTTCCVVASPPSSDGCSRITGRQGNRERISIRQIQMHVWLFQLQTNLVLQLPW